MLCSECQTANDADAQFCSACGKTIGASPEGGPRKQRRTYLYVLLLLPVVLIAAGVGYYKYFLPNGIAAVVNGEEVTLSELDAYVRVQGVGNAQSMNMRSQLLNQLITERIILQEVRNAGITVSKQELKNAVNDARIASDLDETAFRKEIEVQYSSKSAFEGMLARRLLINKFLTQRVIPPGADPLTAQIAVKRWFDGVSGKSIVRVALAEQGAGSGCGGCGPVNGCSQQAGRDQGQKGRGCTTQQKTPASAAKMKMAGDAVLRYWREKHGSDAVTMRPQDFGCHIQVEVVKNDRIIGSLRFQDGTVTEM